MKSETREYLLDSIAAHCTEIEKLFVPGAKVTVLVRNPSVKGDADVLVTNDDIESVRDALKRRMEQALAEGRPDRASASGALPGKRTAAR